MRHWALCLAADTDGDGLLDEDGVVRLWELDLDSLLAPARRAAGRELTAEERKQYLDGGD